MLHTDLLPVPDAHKDNLEGLGLKHDVLHEVVGEVGDVDATDHLDEILLDVFDLVLQGPHRADGGLDDLKTKQE